MKAIEMFAGIGGFHIGLKRAGVEVIWANDINPKACAIYRRHFGDKSIVCDDISAAKSGIPRHDLLTAGFPCQPFSAAGKKQGIRDIVRGTLFSEIVDTLERLKPDCFILENVKRLLTMEHGEHFRTILLALTGAGYFVEWRLLNAKDFGLAQNRERVILVGRKDTGYLSSAPSTFEADHAVLFMQGDLRGGNGLLPFAGLSDLLMPLSAERKFSAAGIASGDRAYSFTPPSFPACGPRVVLEHILEPEADLRFDFTDATNGWLKNNTEVNSFIHGVEILSNQEGGRRMGYTIFGTRGLAPTLTATASRHYERYRVGDRYRRLTNIEYARLQGFKDNWCEAATVYDQYALYGNAVPPVMVAWVAARLMERYRPASKGKRNATRPRHKVATAAGRS
jgi:DNA (cytosine-5)-methyltransferase 1